MRKNSVGLGVLLLTGSVANAATNGTLQLSGSVAAATAIVVTGVSGYNTLDLAASTTDLTVANVREINNTSNGYSVTLSSQNSGALKNGSIGSVAYTAKYNGSSVSLSSTPVTVTTGTPSTSVINTVKQLKVSYSGADPSTLMQGAYSDTLTFTITAN